MRLVALSALALALTACSVTERGAITGGTPSLGVGMPHLDLEGMPDLVVDEDAVTKQWVVRDEKLSASFCSVEEGNVEPGVRRLLRFTVMTPNIGDADLFVGSPLAHMDPNGDGDFSDQDGLFEFASCHAHFHFQHYATYKLIDPATGHVWRAAKRGFCMLDTDPAPAALYGGPPRDKNFLSCGSLDHDGFQGISHGWVDTYRFFLGGQYFVLDGGDGQEPVPAGTYVIEIEVNPAYAPRKGKRGCPLVTDNHGTCRQFAEANYDNNVTRYTITIPDKVGREGHGPLAGTEIASVEEAEH
jgi:hypothetical protein